MINVSQQVTQVLLTLTGGLQERYRDQHELFKPKHNMVASSRSTRRRDSNDNEQQSTHSSSPLSQNITTPNTSLTENPTSTSKRARNASVTETDPLQKRRRLARNSGPEVQIPLRGRASGADSKPATPKSSTKSPGFIQTQLQFQPQPRPPLISQDSTISNSPLNSPSISKPQYDQFKRIEEKAQKAGKKSVANRTIQDDKRRLRSEDGGSRAKTELAQYFPFFDDMMNLNPQDPNVLNLKTPIVLLDDTPGYRPPQARPDYFGTQKPLHKTEIVDLSQYVPTTVPTRDPLGEHVFSKAHLKAERHEKQMKNGDKERAQHEKYQLEKLLEDLRGPDWLKALGISGVTDTEKKRYEPKRLLFIKETKALIDKFKRWKEEEKRRKQEKQQQLQEEADDEADHDATSDVVSVRKLNRPARKLKSLPDSDTRPSSSRAGSQATSSADRRDADSNEMDIMASQQLLGEAKLASLQRKKLHSVQPVAVVDIQPDKPFTSFFEKRHIRDAAVQGRQRGRSVYAFGQIVPELEEEDFELPPSILTEEAIRASQRRGRRVRRGVDD